MELYRTMVQARLKQMCCADALINDLSPQNTKRWRRGVLEMKVIKRGRFRGIGALALTVGLVLAGSQVAWAKRAHSAKPSSGPDPTAVSACGTLAGNDTIYHVTANLTETGTGNCLTISGTGSALLLYGYSITGPGSKTSTGAGIDVTGEFDVIEGFNATVSGFEEGVEDNGIRILGDDINLTGNVTGLLVTSTGHTHDWSNLSVYSNTGNGIWFDGCTDDCFVVDFATTDNGGDGLLVQGTTGFNASVFIAAGNGTGTGGGNGVHLGGTSFFNANTNAVVADGFLASPIIAVSDNIDGNGVLLDTSESAANDQVTTIYATGNGNGASSFDLHDATSTCGTNLWYNNYFGTSRAGTVSSPACIGGLGL